MDESEAASRYSSTEIQLTLDVLRRDVSMLAQRQGDADRSAEVEHGFDVFAEELRADAPVVAIARAAGTGLIVAAAPYADLVAEIANAVMRLLAPLERRAARASTDVAVGTGVVPRRSGRRATPLDTSVGGIAGPPGAVVGGAIGAAGGSIRSEEHEESREGIGPPIYGGEGIGPPLYPHDDD